MYISCLFFSGLLPCLVCLSSEYRATTLFLGPQSDGPIVAFFISFPQASLFRSCSLYGWGSCLRHAFACGMRALSLLPPPTPIFLPLHCFPDEYCVSVSVSAEEVVCAWLSPSLGPVLSCLVQSCDLWSCPVLSYPAWPCSALSCLVLSCPVLSQDGIEPNGAMKPLVSSAVPDIFL